MPLCQFKGSFSQSSLSHIIQDWHTWILIIRMPHYVEVVEEVKQAQSVQNYLVDFGSPLKPLKGYVEWQMQRIRGFPIPDTNWPKGSSAKQFSIKRASTSTSKSCTKALEAEQGPDGLLLAQNKIMRMNRELVQMKANYLKEQ